MKIEWLGTVNKVHYIAYSQNGTIWLGERDRK